MNTEVNKTSRSTRQPLSPLARTAVRTLVGMVMVSGITSLFSRTLVVFTLIALISLVLVARRIRWALLPAALASGALVVYLIQNAAGAYLLLHPKDALSSPVESFTLFVLMLLDICSALVALLTCLAAFVQNDRQGERGRPSWVTPALTGMAGVFVGALLIAAILPVGTSAGATSVNGMPTVHMALDSFVQSTVTVPKGSKLLLVEDVPSTHVLANGSWVKNAAHPATERGVQRLTVVDNSDISPNCLTAWETLRILPSRKKLSLPPISTSEDRYGLLCVRVLAFGLSPPFSGAALASLLAPASAFPLPSREETYAGPPSAQASQP